MPDQLVFEIGCIFDEVSDGVATAALAMQGMGMTAAGLRTCDGNNVMKLSGDELRRITDVCGGLGIRIHEIDSPVLKCVHPLGGEVDTHFVQDGHAGLFPYEEQARLGENLIPICEITGAKAARVFSYTRTLTPEACFEPVCRALDDLARLLGQHSIVCGLEIEHSCTVGTAAEAAKVLAAVNNPNLWIVSDPANAFVRGEDALFGLSQIPIAKVVSTHAKDCHLDENGKPIWGPLGTRHVGWTGIIRTLHEGGYKGPIMLETHWRGHEGNNKFLASRICGENLRGMVTQPLA